MLMLEEVEAKIKFVVEDAREERGNWVLSLRGLSEKAARAVDGLCRFRCGMKACRAGDRMFDTCCKQCATEQGGGGHAPDCSGVASEGVVRGSLDASVDLRSLLPSDPPEPAGYAGEDEAQGSVTRERSWGHGSAAPIASDRESRAATGEPKACSICFDDLDSRTTGVCAWNHTFCNECLRRHVEVELEDKGILPACPLSSECGQVLESRQVEQILGESEKADACKKLFKLLEQRMGLRALGAFPCANCEDWMVPSRPGQQQLVECPNCEERFCSLCRRRPYHFRAQCKDIPAIERAWHDWLHTGRDQYLARLAAEDATYQAAVDLLTSKKAEQERMLAEADARKREFDEMEKWKEAHCKTCPNCGRTIEKLDGCDSMMCGQNYHGGDVQNGCGHKFQWSAASAYTADTGGSHHTVVEEKDLGPSPEARQKTYWKCGQDLYLRCAMCKKAIEGPCFICIDCYACCACLLCANGTGSAAGGRHKPDSHVFQILWRPSELSRHDARHFRDNRLVTPDGPAKTPEQILGAMGFSDVQVKSALDHSGGDVDQAAKYLLGDA